MSSQIVICYTIAYIPADRFPVREARVGRYGSVNAHYMLFRILFSPHVRRARISRGFPSSSHGTSGYFALLTLVSPLITIPLGNRYPLQDGFRALMQHTVLPGYLISTRIIPSSRGRLLSS